MGEGEPAGEGVTAADFVAATVGVVSVVAVFPDPGWLIARKKTSRSEATRTHENSGYKKTETRITQ